MLINTAIGRNKHNSGTQNTGIDVFINKNSMCKEVAKLIRGTGNITNYVEKINQFQYIAGQQLVIYMKIDFYLNSHYGQK